MRKVALLYNPAAGKNRARRLAEIQAAAQVLGAAGIECLAVPTSAPGSAGQQARQAVAQGCDTVVACGGDGTVHDTVQGLAGTETPLGVIPFGTGNALANDLGLPRHAAGAAGVLLESRPRRIALGKLEYLENSGGQQRSRYFVVIAGAGVDARMLYQMNVAAKQSLGMLAYYAEAFHLFFAHRFQRFEAEFTDVEGVTRSLPVTQVMAVRLRQFGGILRRLAPDAALERDEFQLVLFRNASRISYSLYLLRALLEQRWNTPGVDLVRAREVVCRPLPGVACGNIYAEADGEILGGLPVRMSVIPQALTLLLPANRRALSS